jgi:hypothetical protein
VLPRALVIALLFLLYLAFPGGTLEWRYQLDADTLNSQVVGGTCAEPGPDVTWEFERQA